MYQEKPKSCFRGSGYKQSYFITEHNYIVSYCLTNCVFLKLSFTVMLPYKKRNTERKVFRTLIPARVSSLVTPLLKSSIWLLMCWHLTLFLRVQEIHPTKTAAGNRLSSKQKCTTLLFSDKCQRTKLGLGNSVTSVTHVLLQCYESLWISFCPVTQFSSGLGSRIFGYSWFSEILVFCTCGKE